jgi:hypothetical protein
MDVVFARYIYQERGIGGVGGAHQADGLLYQFRAYRTVSCRCSSANLERNRGGGKKKGGDIGGGKS